jgi:hypothetical protein
MYLYLLQTILLTHLIHLQKLNYFSKLTMIINLIVDNFFCNQNLRYCTKLDSYLRAKITLYM